jgi:hypothetical protein
MSRPLEGFPDLRAFTVSLSRRNFRDMRFRHLVWPSLDSPELAFPESAIAQAECWRAELIDLRPVYMAARRSGDRKKILGVAHRMRVLHLKRVNAAEGYRWPGSGNSYLVAFAGDEK